MSNTRLYYRQMPYVMAIDFALTLLLLFLCPDGQAYWAAGGLAIAALALIFYIRGCRCFTKEVFTALEKAVEEQQVPGTKDPLVLELADYVSSALTQHIESKYEEEMSDKRLELSALQRQINPHFLYNTLDTIRAEALIGGNTTVAEMTEALAMLFRYSISKKGNIVTIADELRNIRYYLLIQKFRFEDRFEYEITCEDGAAMYCCPKLTIQPFVENALFHGLENRSHGGLLRVSIRTTDQRVEIRVEDNGAGMDVKKLEMIQQALYEKASVPDEVRTGNGIAMVNVQQRIQLAFGKEYGVEVYSEPDNGTIVLISLPKKRTVEE